MNSVFTKDIKNWSAFLLMLITVVMASCSSDSSDEPDDPADDEIGMNVIPASVLPGQWLIQNFTSEGKVTEINRTITILPFEVKQTSSNIVTETNGDKYWAEIYSKLLMYESIDGPQTENLTLGFLNKKGTQLSSSYIYEFGLTFKDSDLQVTTVIVMADLSYSNNVLTAKNSAYGTVPGSMETSVGTITMKKLQ